MADTKLGFTKGILLSFIYTPVVGLFVFLVTPNTNDYWDVVKTIDKQLKKKQITQEQYDEMRKNIRL